MLAAAIFLSFLFHFSDCFSQPHSLASLEAGASLAAFRFHFLACLPDYPCCTRQRNPTGLPIFFCGAECCFSQHARQIFGLSLTGFAIYIICLDLHAPRESFSLPLERGVLDSFACIIAHNSRIVGELPSGMPPDRHCDFSRTTVTRAQAPA